jgi:eukaryotic-like serine/threonine-protein kinase
VVMFPGSGSINGGSSRNTQNATAEWMVRSGRALVFPILKSTHERADSLNSDYANETIFYRDHVVMWAKDIRRTLDYLETRAEFDPAKFGYLGYSWGGFHGGLVPAVEPRIKASVLYVAGLGMERARPEADVVNFLPRVKQPTLMLNGRQDFFFPVETAQEPFFRYLGTPAADKVYKVYEGGHDVPRTELIKESLAWFDRYLGPVR